MRHSLILVAVLIAGPAFGQTTTATSHPFGLDPYKPSDAQILREFGDVLAQQIPLAELAKLDPYTPSEAAWRRRIGAGLPLPITGYLYYPPAGERAANKPAPAPTPVASAAPDARPTSTPSAPVASSPTEVTTLLRPETNDGVWIRFAGDKWLSAGRAVLLDSSFMRAGDYAGFTVYRRQGASDGMIYLPTRDGMVAPYRRKP